MESGLATLNRQARPRIWPIEAVHALALLFVPCSANAADDPALEEVLVTARRVSERAFDLPLTVNVFATDTLNAAGVRRLQDLASQAPGLSFEEGFGAGGGAVTLRGQSQSSGNGDNVAIFVDGVYQANRSAIDLEFLDIERVELLRGPQNTLFGQSAFAGALQVISKAPTRTYTSNISLEGGNRGWRGVQGVVSGPVATTGWLGRMALSYRTAGGSYEDSSSGDELGAFSRSTLAASLARDVRDEDAWTASLSMRHSWSAAGHPAVSSIAGAEFNCGGRDPVSGYWSYYCGSAPESRSFELSEVLPDSTTQVTQAMLRFGMPVLGLRFESDTSYYRGDALVIRDFDVSANGQLFGVCTISGSCLGSSTRPALVDRLMAVNQVLSQRPSSSQFLQELRLRSDAAGELTWQAGMVLVESRERVLTGIGAERGDLAADEVLVAMIPGSPQAVGPVSRMNRALVDDPAATQIVQSRSHERRRTLATYASLDWHPIGALELRAELRRTREWIRTNSITANFLPSFGTLIPEQTFNDFTPRLSVDYAWNTSLHTYVSSAKGSRSGGINTIPGLIPEEQTYAPEYNWTYEAGLRFAGQGLVRRLLVSVYRIDWRHAQITGFSTTPGVTNLITLNTAGLQSDGIEVSLDLQPAAWLRGEFRYSHVDARFRHGSDDPSSGALCGLTTSNPTSSFCTVGPPRHASPNGSTVVPWLDGNQSPRAPKYSAYAALVVVPEPIWRDWRIELRADLSHQGAMYDRGIDAFTYGARTVLGAQATVKRASWSISLWGRNLTSERFVRSFTSRQAQFFPTSPRPLDFIHDGGRRIGITVRHSD